MAIAESEYYGTLVEATAYFAKRLYPDAWDDSAVADRPKALLWATNIIDALNFRGYKKPVYDIVYDSSGNILTDAPTQAEIRAAEITQDLEFPRGTDTTVPDTIKIATWEIAYNLLDGVQPELEVENLAVTSQGISSVRTSYDRSFTPIEHLINGIPSATAWRYLKPFLRDAEDVKLSRIS